ncbi:MULTISPECIES: hypothetical protein [unclassified Streptomyces]|uniref:hypothetical protein n=1 Tax=unclassified Streptomyces TaxID=2593676 RepID=UPI0036EB5F75
MRVRVRFRFNTDTGEVELFQVDDIGDGSGPEHEAEHDRVSAELGRLLARRPDIEEVSPVEEPPLWRHDPRSTAAPRSVPAETEDEETEGSASGEQERS